MNRFTPEHRGEEFPEEWCIIDEEFGWYGSAIIYDLDRETAIHWSELMNANDELIRSIFK